ncbi:MAG: hypothetical protein C5B54_11000 [Acidobacteria bacterium]|nr:MAG: hypothetical protein C5B54_11000 [Acidobacteriota bacterium]
MIKQTDLAAIISLNGELQQIRFALQLFDEGGRIIRMDIVSGVGVMPGRTVTIDTAYMSYPQQMIEAIKSFLHAREQAVHDELAALGITGIAAR